MTGLVTLAEATALTAALLICGTALNGLANLPIYLGVAAGFPMVITFTNLLAMVIIVPAMIALTRTFGMAGAASVWVVLNSLYIVITVPLVHRRVLPREKWTWYADDFGKPVIVAGAVAAVARLLMPRNLNLAGTIAYVATSGLVTALATAAVLPHVVALLRNVVRATREARA
jgi:hypothetical protein